jgi:trk system potassium uptake protein TrkH
LNFRRVARLLSITTAAISIFLLLPTMWSAVLPDGGFRPLALSLVVGAAVSAAFFFLGRGVSPSNMNNREAILSVAGSWMTASLIAGLPYLFSGAAATPLDAIFEGVSGFTTTGATVIRSLENVPRSILLWRSFSQWLGGIGIVVLTLAFVPVSGAGMQLYKAEVTGPIHERLTPRIQQTASFLCKTYLALTFAEVILLGVGGLGIYDSLTLAFSTVATGGFSPYSDNVGHFAGNYVKWVTAVFLFMSATNLTFFHTLIVKRSLSPLSGNPEMRFYIGTLVTFGGAVSLILYNKGIYADPLKSLTEGFFHTISMLSTCGFFTTDYNAWPASARMLMLALMFCGGCAISTAGGMTCVRILVVLRHTIAEFRRRLHPRAMVPTMVGDAPAESSVISSCFAYFTAYITIFAAGFMLLTLFGQDMTTAISGAAATLGNVGPGFGLTGPSEGYASMPDAVKAVHIFLMLCGRLELFTLLVIFTPRFWRV